MWISGNCSVMRIEIPVLVEPDVHPEGGGSIYRVRPLLFEGPDRSDRILATALAKLAAALEKDLNELGRSGKHEELAALTYTPEVELKWLDLRLDLRDKPFRGKFPVVILQEFDRLLAFTPSLDDLWFERRTGRGPCRPGDGRLYALLSQRCEEPRRPIGAAAACGVRRQEEALDRAGGTLPCHARQAARRQGPPTCPAGCRRADGRRRGTPQRRPLPRPALSRPARAGPSAARQPSRNSRDCWKTATCGRSSSWGRRWSARRP